MGAPDGPYASLAAQVRERREKGLQEERALQQKALRNFEPQSASDPAALCFYCHRPADPVSDCWIGHSTVAHYQCAWDVSDEFFLALEAESKRDEDANTL